MVMFLLPFINTAFHLNLDFNLIENSSPFLYLLLLTVLVSVLSASYPAFILSKLKPVDAMKGKVFIGSAKKILPKALIAFQFAVSLIFIVYTLVISKQMTFIKTRDLGFKPDHLIYFSLREIEGKEHTLRNELMNNPNIENTAIAEYSLGRSLNIFSPFTIGEGDQNADMNIPVVNIGPGFFETLGVPLVRGRDFSYERVADKENTVIINESTARLLGWENPIGKKIYHNMYEKNLEIIGVVKDCVVEPLYKKIQPYIFYYYPIACGDMLARVNPAVVSETVNYIRNKWLQYAPDNLFTYRFVDEKIWDVYIEERNIGIIIRYASLLAILISSMGLFGLVLISVEKRKKEIGIRKVIGASVKDILFFNNKRILIPAGNLLCHCSADCLASFFKMDSEVCLQDPFGDRYIYNFYYYCFHGCVYYCWLSCHQSRPGQSGGESEV
jgi:putative ABC transport system permease protein